MLVVEGARANLVSADGEARTFWLADASNLIEELERALASRAFTRLTVIASTPVFTDLAREMSPRLRAAASMQRAHGHGELLPDEIAVRLRRLGSALALLV
jgi:hypothetical protein